MLSKHASLSINVVTIFNTDCANPSIFQADLFVYTICNRFGVLRYRDIFPFCPSWTELGSSLSFVYSLYEGHKSVCFCYCFISSTRQSSTAVWATFCQLRWVLLYEPRTLYFLDDFLEAFVHPVFIKEVWFLRRRKIDSRRDVRAENIRQPL